MNFIRTSFLSAMAFSLFFISFSGCTTLQRKAPQQTNTNESRKLSYQENYYGEKHWYSFSVTTDCPSPQPLRIKMFESERNYNSVKTGETTSVRIINIYADVVRKIDCSEVKKDGIFSKKIEIPVDNKRMTHVYVTYAPDIQINSGH